MAPLYRGAALRERILALPPRERDAWVDRWLGFDDVPDDAPDLPRGCVPYLPCGVDEILAAVDGAPLGPDDHLVDVGSGLGRVAILAHLLTGARSEGIEIQEPLVQRARAHAAALGLSAVSFVHGDAAATELDGSVFFLYAPCGGAMLAEVLARLEAVARRRRVVVCTVGMELGAVAWLSPRASACVSLTFHDSR
jgi:precorrin-6B methylase 2